MLTAALDGTPAIIGHTRIAAPKVTPEKVCLLAKRAGGRGWGDAWAVGVALRGITPGQLLDDRILHGGAMALRGAKWTWRQLTDRAEVLCQSYSFGRFSVGAGLQNAQRRISRAKV